jgi:hypothetical protein
MTPLQFQHLHLDGVGWLASQIKGSTRKSSATHGGSSPGRARRDRLLP